MVQQPRPYVSAAGARACRTLFLSDFHLGKRHCQDTLLLDFLQKHEADTIYLVGDIFDIWCLTKRMYWPDGHQRVFQLLTQRAEAGTQIIYLPGNHDELLRAQTNLSFGPIRFADELVHTCADGRRFLVIHGDQYDVVLRKLAWLGPLGDWFYDLVLELNKGFAAMCRAFGTRAPFSLSAVAKHVVKRTVNHASHFEDVVTAELKSLGVDGIICGHVHEAALRDLNGFQYVNCGDWVESCTAVIEHDDGRLEVVSWLDAEPEPDLVDPIPVGSAS